jgi:tetratricopeptide (TPR) repeat protein
MKSQIIQEIQAAMHNNNYPEALRLCKRLTAEFPDNPESYILTGDVYMEMDDFGNALQQFENALALDPGSATACFKLGLAHDCREELQAAIEKLQVARKLDPSNPLYEAHHGRLLHEKGRKTNNAILIKEGFTLMGKAVEAGHGNYAVKEQLAIAYLEEACSKWVQDPNDKDKILATSAEAVEWTKHCLEKARELTDGSNVTINNTMKELETAASGAVKREYHGYNYILKAPAIIGGVLLVFGQTALGILLLVSAGLYYLSQLKPAYLHNRLYVKNQHRDPFVIRRINAVAEGLGGFVVFGSVKDILFFRMVSSLVFGVLTYMMVIVMLPYEIGKGFWINYELKGKIAAKAAR